MGWAAVTEYYSILFLMRFQNRRHRCTCLVPIQEWESCYEGVWSSVPVLPWTMEARSRHFRWMRGKRRSGIRFTVRRIKTEEENELCYVALGTCFCDNISTLRDGMRCTESKLIFCCAIKLLIIHKLDLQPRWVARSLVWRETRHELGAENLVFNIY